MSEFNFSATVQTIVGPALEELGFVEDEVDDNVDEGGRLGAVVFYRSGDCKLQIYRSSRAGEVNSMIAPLAASNVFGLTDSSGYWQYLKRFVPRPNLSISQLAQLSSQVFESDEERIVFERDNIVKYFPYAHAGILEMFGDR
jgi:hypothetical protein